ncbi:MAG: hypothetical protein EA401_04380 [Planctomycetota bacterium]|nr:MAG: hypothetical protein EA401_04380 [Planctomycetota bacterium]
MIFLNLLLAGGLLAASAPLIVHILHQRKLKRIDWGAMRFLRDMLTRRRKRLRIEHWLLLLLRTLALILLAVALMRPQLPMSQEQAISADFSRQGAVAAVLLIDDSATSAVGTDSARLEQLKEIALAYIDGLEVGDEVSIITRSALGKTLPPPLYDLRAAREMVSNLEPSDVAGDHPALLSAGMDQLIRHLNPQRELVLISDGARTGWRQDDRSGWANVQRRLREAGSERRARPQLLVLQPELPGAEDVAITAVSMQRNLLPVGSEANLRIQLAHFGERDPGNLRLRVEAGEHGERKVYDEDLPLERGEQREVVVPISFNEAGAHPVTVAIVGARDDNPRNDSYAMVVEAFEQLPVLVVEGRSGSGLSGSGAFVALALQPDDEARDAVSQAFAVTRIHVDDMASHPLEDYRCIVLADVGVLESAALSRLERAVFAGAGLLTAFAPDSDIAYVNRFLAREGQGVLPTPLGSMGDAANGPVSAAIALPGHPSLIGLRDAGDRGLNGAEVSRWLRIDDGGLSDVTIPLRWTNGDAALVLRRRGLGNSALLTTSVDLRHSRLPLVEGWAPLLRNIVSELASPIRPPRNLHPGNRLTIVADGSVQAVDPQGEELLLDEGVWEERRVLQSAPLTQVGLYHVQGAGESAQYFALASEADAWDPRIASDTAIEQQLAGLQAMRLRDTQQVQALAGEPRQSGRELWPWLIVLCVLVLLIEGAVAARGSLASQGGRS